MINKKNKIRDLKEKLNISGYYLAKKTGISNTLIYNIINDKATNVTIKTLKKIADALNVRVEDLI
jgi:transcriptional regulator with XRE-family HTH domain